MPTCPACGGFHVSLFGHQSGKQRYRCRDCQKTWRDNPQPHGTDPRRKAQILAAYHERMSMRGLARTFGVSRGTVTTWLKKASLLPPLSQTLVPAQTDDVLELDEMWSFVKFRKNKRWVWLAQCRRTRQIVAYAVGDRSETTCRLLWARVPPAYKRGVLYTDFWSAYAEVLPKGQHRATQHRATGKGAGQTCHIERFNGILRQRLARFVRRTLSFSKIDEMHEMCLLLHQHNRRIQIILNN